MRCKVDQSELTTLNGPQPIVQWSKFDIRIITMSSFLNCGWMGTKVLKKISENINSVIWCLYLTIIKVYYHSMKNVNIVWGKPACPPCALAQCSACCGCNKMSQFSTFQMDRVLAFVGCFTCLGLVVIQFDVSFLVVILFSRWWAPLKTIQNK